MSFGRQWMICLLLMLAGCSTGAHNSLREWQEDTICTEGPMRAIYRSDGQRLDFRQAVKQMSDADYVLAGENHDNPYHHLVQAQLIVALGAQKRFQNVYLEMLEPAHDESVARYLSGRLTINELEKAIAWTDRGWPEWDAYAKIFSAARRGNMRVSHGNPDRDLVRAINQQGIAALPETLRQELGILPDGPFLIDFEAMKAEISRHHRLPPEVNKRYATSQYVKDAYMARRMASLSGGILIAGNGHVRADLGVPKHLAAYRPGATVVSIHLISEPPAGRDTARRAARANDGRKRYDLVWFTGQPCRSGGD